MSMQESPSLSQNVVSLFNKAKATEAEVALEAQAAADSEESFEDVMRRNAETKEKLRKERLKSNQAVLRSYRIKN